MPESILPRTPSVKKWWLYLSILLILGLGVHLLLPQISTFEKSVAVLKTMTWWLIALAALAQVLSYVGSGYMVHAVAANRYENFSVRRGMLITLASYSFGLIAGGWIGGAAATYGWMRKSKANSDSAFLVSILPALLNDAALTVISIIGMVYLFLAHDLTRKQLIGYGLVLVFLGLLLMITVVSVKRPKVIKRFSVWLGSSWAKLHHRIDFQPEQTEQSVDRIIDAWRSLDHGRWVKPAIGAFVNIGFDMLTLYLVFLAAGYRLNLGILFAGYSLPLMLGKIAFIFPGGLGVIEGSMAAIFESLKVPSDIAVVSILGYRLLSFWLPLLFGFPAALFLGREDPKKES